jgi:hypothetical protein
VTITKLYASDQDPLQDLQRIGVTTGTVGGTIYWGVAVNGVPSSRSPCSPTTGTDPVLAFHSGWSTSRPLTTPRLNAVGLMNVLWYVSTTSGTNWNVDPNDSFYGPAGIISEVA